MHVDDGRVSLSASSNATLEMDSEPANNAVTPTAANLVSMFTANARAVKLVRYLNWASRPGAVRAITGASYAVSFDDS